MALNLPVPAETKTVIVPAGSDDSERLYSYLYVSERFAAGGIWERAKEFDNEQHRWEVTFPLTGDGYVNRSYFLRPGEGYLESDPRHDADGSEVLFHRNAILALYPDNGEEYGKLIGVLPKGQWIQTSGVLYGYVHGVYAAVFMKNAFKVQEEADRITVISHGSHNGVVIEAIGPSEAKGMNIVSLEEFVSAAEGRHPVWHITLETMSVKYVMIDGDRLAMVTNGGSFQTVRSINGKPIDFQDYYKQ